MERRGMKLKDGLILREVAGQYVIVPTGKAVREIHGVCYMNAVGAYLWNYMQQGEFEKEDLTEQLYQQFPSMEKGRLEKDVEEFLEEIRNRHLLEEGLEAGSAYIQIPASTYKKK